MTAQGCGRPVGRVASATASSTSTGRGRPAALRSAVAAVALAPGTPLYARVMTARPTALLKPYAGLEIEYGRTGAGDGWSPARWPQCRARDRKVEL